MCESARERVKSVGAHEIRVPLFDTYLSRNATISRNEFVWIGDSAMAAWGRTTDNRIFFYLYFFLLFLFIYFNYM